MLQCDCIRHVLQAYDTLVKDLNCSVTAYMVVRRYHGVMNMAADVEGGCLQALFRAESPHGASAESLPFVAAIVGPYDPTLPDEVLHGDALQCLLG